MDERLPRTQCIDGYVVELDFDVVRQENGSYVAMSSKWPALVVAPDFATLQARIADVTDSLRAHFERAGDQGMLDELAGRGIEPTRVGPSVAKITVPVLVGA